MYIYICVCVCVYAYKGLSPVMSTHAIQMLFASDCTLVHIPGDPVLLPLLFRILGASPMLTFPNSCFISHWSIVEGNVMSLSNRARYLKKRSNSRVLCL